VIRPEHGPECTGVHDNNRYHELCWWSLMGKRQRDNKYHETAKGCVKRARAHFYATVARSGMTEEEWEASIGGRQQAVDEINAKWDAMCARWGIGPDLSEQLLGAVGGKDGRQ
jgi:hypothetical protein